MRICHPAPNQGWLNNNQKLSKEPANFNNLRTRNYSLNSSIEDKKNGINR